MQCHLNRQLQCITQCLIFLYISLGVLISSFITCLVFLLVNLNLRLPIDAPYIFSALIIFATGIVQRDIIVVDTICLKFFAVGIPTLLQIFLDNLSLSICLIVNPTIFTSTMVTILNFSIVYFGLNTYSPCLFLLYVMIPILV